jgi:ubiquinone/menaquinone biosynthesis C-methylase UbiE
MSLRAAVSTEEAQRRVDGYFATQVSAWTEIYNYPGLVPSIYQQRLSVSLRWIEELALAPDERLLDVGCGAGLAAVTLAQRGFLVDAVDSVGDMVRRTRQAAAEAGLAQRVTTAVEDAHHLTFPDATFRLVLALGVLPWLPAARRALGEMARVVRPDGYVLVSADNRWRLTDLLDPWRSPALDPIKGAAAAVLRQLGLRRRPPQREPSPQAVSIAELDRWLWSVGLSRVKTTTLGFAHFTCFSRHLFTGATSAKFHRALQRWADRNVPLVRWLGNQHIVLAQKVSNHRAVAR